MTGGRTAHVVVVGGGFAGVACARRLAGQPGVRVTLLDRNAYHQFLPLLYQVATAELTPGDIRFDLEAMFAKYDNVEVRTGEVVAVDPAAPAVTLADGEVVGADVVVLAAGSQPNFFHTPGADRFTFPLYSLEDAERVRSRVLQLFQDASTKPELVHDVLPHVHPPLAVAGARVILVDLGHALLAPFSDEAHTYAARQLQRRGVQLKLGTSAKEVAAGRVTLSDGSTIPTHLTVWGGGLMAAPLAASAGLSQGRGGRIDVRPDLTVDGFPAVYALGDFANIPAADEQALPQLGSVAQQAGDRAGRNILDNLRGQGRQPFQYHDKGIMAMIGRKAAVAEIGEHRHELHGRLAFAAWLGVHAQLLANADAELNAFLSWADEFYLRSHHRSAALLDPATIDTPRIHWNGR